MFSILVNGTIEYLAFKMSFQGCILSEFGINVWSKCKVMGLSSLKSIIKKLAGPLNANQR